VEGNASNGTTPGRVDEASVFVDVSAYKGLAPEKDDEGQARVYLCMLPHVLAGEAVIGEVTPVDPDHREGF